jgi:hypothetical protein
MAAEGEDLPKPINPYLFLQFATILREGCDSHEEMLNR